MGIGEKIKTLRKQLKMTQTELAEKIGVHETTIRRWEQEVDRGPDGKSVNLLANVLHTTPEFLLTDTEYINKNDLPLVQPNLNVTPNMSYWGGVVDNAKIAAENNENLKTIYTLLTDAVGVIKSAMAHPYTLDTSAVPV